MVRKITAGEFKTINRILEQHTGITLAGSKRELAFNRLISRLRTLGYQTFEEYLLFVSSEEGHGELQRYIDRLTTHETYFFRESEQFDFLYQYYRRSRNRKYPMRAWSAACSTGEEVYSLAMVMDDLFFSGNWGVTGTDVSETAVAIAKEAHYAISTVSKIPRAYRRGYCLRGVGEHENSFMLCKSIRRYCQFYVDNLLELNNTTVNYDIIFLRNVLIYFSDIKQRQIIENVSNRLNYGGLLFLGHSESLRSKRDDLVMLQPCIYKKVR